MGWLLGPDCRPERDTGMADGCIALLVPARGLLGDGSSNARGVLKKERLGESWVSLEPVLGSPPCSLIWLNPRI